MRRKTAGTPRRSAGASFAISRIGSRRRCWFLSFVWLVLVAVELIRGASQMLEVFGTAIWVVFVAEFLVRLALAPEKLPFLRRNLLTMIALVAPAFRLLRGLRIPSVRARRAGTAPRAHRRDGEPRYEGPAGELSAARDRICSGIDVDRDPARSRRHARLRARERGRGRVRELRRRSLVDCHADDQHRKRVLAGQPGGADPVFPAFRLRLRGVRLHHGGVRLLLRRAGCGRA